MKNQLLQKQKGGFATLERTGEVDYILDLALEESCRMVKAKTSNFYLNEPDGSLKPFRESLDNDEIRSLAEACLREQIPVNVSPGDGGSFHAVTEPTLCIPMSTQEGPLGVMVLRGTQHFDYFFEYDLSLARNFAATFSILLRGSWSDHESDSIFLNFKSSLLLLLENAHLNQKVREANQQLTTVLEVSNVINSSRQLNEMVEKVLQSARQVIRAESASLFLIDEQTGEMVFDVISGEKTELRGVRIPQGMGIVGLCAGKKQSIIVNDAENDPRVFKKVDEVFNNVTRNLLACPLLVDGNVIGVIELINTIDRADFLQQDLDIFESFSDSVAIAIQRRRLLDDLQTTNLALERKLSEVTSLHAVAAVLVEARSVEELFQKVLVIIRKDLGVNRASIVMKNGDSFDTVARSGDYNDQADQEHYTLTKHVMETGEALFVNDIQSDSVLAGLAGNSGYLSGACILIPITGPSGEPIGLLSVSDPTSGSFSHDDFRLLGTIASQMMRGFENFRLSRELLEKSAIEKEVEITSKIQQNILPTKPLEHSFVKLAARSIMAKTTGGDFYDYYVHPETGEVTMLVADVSGKSLPAALFMAVSTSILRTIIRSDLSPAEILHNANELLFEESESGMFVTVFLSKYRPSTGTLRFASAGHNEMILVRADESVEVLSAKGAPLGVMPARLSQYEGNELKAEPDDLLVLYTDGVVEAINPDNQEYGMENFIRLVRQNRTLPPERIIDLVYRNVTSFSGSELQYDDFTMLVSRLDVDKYDTVRKIFQYPAKPGSVPRLRDDLGGVFQKCGIAGQLLDDLLLVSDEAATNIVLHAFENESKAAPVFDCKVSIRQGEEISLEFRDYGKPFKLNEVKEPNVQENLAGRRRGGFGVYLIRTLMDSVDYARSAGENVLRILKKL